MYEKTFDEMSGDSVFFRNSFFQHSRSIKLDNFNKLSVKDKKHFLSPDKFRYYKSKQLSFIKRQECFNPIDGRDELSKSTEKGRIIIGFNVYKFKRVSNKIVYTFRIWSDDYDMHYNLAEHIKYGFCILDYL